MLGDLLALWPFLILAAVIVVFHLSFRADRRAHACKTCGQPFCLKDHSAPGAPVKRALYPRPGGGYCPFGEHWDPWG